MQRTVKRAFIFLSAAAIWIPIAAATQIPVGYISWDVDFPGNAGQFDITNLSGPNNAPPTFPITTTVSLSSLNLVVNFVGGGSATYGPTSGYFSLDPIDGESFNGTAIPIGGTNPEPLNATLTGVFSPTSINVSGSGTVSIQTAFTVTFSDTPSLVDGDFGVIYATTVTTSGVPEPGTWMLLGLGLAGLGLARSMKARSMKSMVKRGASVAVGGLLPVLCLVMAQSVYGQLVLSGSTSPSSGVAGVDNVNVTGSDVPYSSGSITPADVSVTWATSCGGAAVATDTVNSVRALIGSSDRFNVNIPSSLATGTYYVKLTDATTGQTFTSTNCSGVQVTGSTSVLNACVAGSSMGVLLPANGAAGTVTAYTPKGWWGSGTTGIFVKNIEGTLGTGSSIATPNVTNSCSSNPATGQTVCVANNTDIYVINGTTLATTYASGSNTTAGFSGGSCNNCGVALNANNNTAVINMGLTGSLNGGLQVLSLGAVPPSNPNPAGFLYTPFPLTGGYTSENISVDPTRSLILSAGEDGKYTIAQLQASPAGSLKEFDSSWNTGVENDSNAEDCSTGIAIAPGEFTNSLGMANFNSPTLTTSPYTVPNAVATLATSTYSFSAGLSGSAVAQGSGHLAVVTGEFGGNVFAVLQLPATVTSTTTPSVVDYAIAQIPSSTACGGAFSAGFDPHTITAYTSPNGAQHAMAVFAGYNGSGVPGCLAVVDMTVVINSTLTPRGVGGYGAHEVNPTSLPSSAVTFFSLP
jgi:hypothetical protein